MHCRRVVYFTKHIHSRIEQFPEFEVEVGRLTDKPNRYPIFFKTETDTDFGILKTGKYRIPTKNNRKTDTVGYFPVS